MKWQKWIITWTWRLSAGLLLMVGLLMLPTVGYAHLVKLVSSFPENGMIMNASPGVVTAVFNEEAQTASTIELFDDQGQQIDNGDGGVDLNDPNHASMRVSVPSLAEGTYTVRWHVVLLDGDATDGAFNFFVGDEAAANAANFAPIPDGSDVETTAVPGTGPNNTIWLVAGILVSALFIGGAFFIFSRRNNP